MARRAIKQIASHRQMSEQARFLKHVAHRSPPCGQERLAVLPDRIGDANVAALAERLPAPLVADIEWNARGDPEFALHDAPRRELGLSAASSA